MSEDFTPPVTPPLHEDDKYFDENYVSVEEFVNGNEENLSKRCSFRWFSCSGEAGQELKLNECSILSSGEETIFDLHDNGDLNWPLKKHDHKSSVKLFGYDFDKGSALLCNLDLLFKFARYELMNIDSVANTHGKFGVIQHNKDFAESRRHLVQFFLYIREYLFHLIYSRKNSYHEILRHLRHILGVKLFSFRCLMRRITDLPEYICQHAASHNSTSVRSGYHVFHCHLDLSWFHLTSLLLLNYYTPEENEFRDAETSYLASIPNNSSQFIGPQVVDFSINFLVSDLIQLAVLRFEKIALKDILERSPFNCTCVRELWLLIQLLCDDKEREASLGGFWNVINKFLNCVLGVEMDNVSPKEIGALKIIDSYSCSNPPIFVMWLTSHLSSLYKYNDRLMRSNYNLLENALKEVLRNDVSESSLQLYIPFVSSFCLDLWEPRSEPIVLLWDYFQRRLNNTFYLPGASLDKIAIISKSPIGLISQADSRLAGNKQENSFEQFLQLLGLFLKRTENNPKHWNQLRGRIYSKFPASKISGFSETGLYHFVSLFITMATARRDNASEICKKLQDFLHLVDENQLTDVRKKKLIWQTHLGIILLLAERQLDLSQAIMPLVNSVKTINMENNLPLMKMFIEGFQDVIDSSNSVTSGQSNFIDDWIPRYLNICPESDAAVLINTISAIVRRIKTKQSFEQDDLELFEKLWFHMRPYMESIGKTSSECPLQIADVAADLAVISIKVSHTALRFREMVNVFTSNETVDMRILRRFLYNLIQYKPLRMALPDHNTFVIKLWIRCSMLSMDVQNEELKELSQYVLSLPEIKCLPTFNETISDSLMFFFSGLRQKYDSIQNINEKGEMRDRVVRYFDGLKQWLQHLIKNPNCRQLLNRIYTVIGNMIIYIGPLIYVKSHPMTILQMLMDLLLLPLSIRKPDHKLHPAISSAIKSTIHLYMEGLIKLGVDHDNYILRIAQELIVLYLPRCMPLPGERNVNNSRTFSLVQCFNCSYQSEDKSSVPKFILETIKNNFIKQRVRSPQPVCKQALQFLKDVLLVHGCNNFLLSLMIPLCLENVCCVIMYCEDRNSCKNDATDIMLQVLDSQPLRTDHALGDELMKMFSRLCKEHLAFSSRQLFSLFTLLSTSGPDFVFRFLPALMKHIKEVESKRAVGFDRALRAEYDNLEKSLNYLQR